MQTKHEFFQLLYLVWYISHKEVRTSLAGIKPVISSYFVGKGPLTNCLHIFNGLLCKYFTIPDLVSNTFCSIQFQSVSYTFLMAKSYAGFDSSEKYSGFAIFNTLYQWTLSYRKRTKWLIATKSYLKYSHWKISSFKRNFIISNLFRGHP